MKIVELFPNAKAPNRAMLTAQIDANLAELQDCLWQLQKQVYDAFDMEVDVNARRVAGMIEAAHAELEAIDSGRTPPDTVKDAAVRTRLLTTAVELLFKQQVVVANAQILGAAAARP